ncbi:MAG TPA: hypothetical protein VLF39_02850 [Candidatus Saccharimonadales bacterium]|nr:hypothetical protein [Candidatus Saccharimonadales bacterium]
MANRENWLSDVDDFEALEIADGILDRIGLSPSIEYRNAEAIKIAAYIMERVNQHKVDDELEIFEEEFNG